MKKEKFSALLAEVDRCRFFRNDGRGNLFHYEPRMGIWIRQTPLLARQNLEAFFENAHVTLYREELENVRREIRERNALTESRLALDTPTTLVAVKNGVIDLATGKRNDHDPSLYLRHALDFEFQEDVQTIPVSNAWVRFAITSLGVDERNLGKDPLWRLFMEVIFFPLSNLGNAKKMLIFLGPPNCGKSVVLNFLGRVIGEGSYISLTLDDMIQRFRGSLMEGNRVVLSHEMPLKPLRRLDILKKIISSEPIIVEEKCRDAKQITPRVNIVFAANNLPRLAEPDAGGAFADRLLVVPFQKVTHRDNELLEKLWKDRDVFLTVAARSMMDFIKRDLVFSDCEKGTRILEEYENECFSVSAFINEYYERKVGSRICLADFYEDYTRFCDEAMLSAIPKSEFMESLNLFNLRCERTRVEGYPNARKCVIGLARKQCSD